MVASEPPLQCLVERQTQDLRICSSMGSMYGGRGVSVCRSQGSNTGAESYSKEISR